MWTNKQKQLFTRACQGAGLTDEHRRLILGQCDDRAVHQGRVTSTSPRLNQGDFEHCMAVVEASSIAHQCVDGKGRALSAPHYWQTRQRDGELKRLRWLARDLAGRLSAALVSWPDAETALCGWIRDRIRGGEPAAPEALTRRELTDLVHGLKAYARRHGVSIESGP